MPAQMHIVITLRKEIPDRETGQAIYELVKERLADRTDIEIHGLVTNHFEPVMPEPP